MCGGKKQESRSIGGKILLSYIEKDPDEYKYECTDLEVGWA
jgi:hypothetical protein